jgi:hypothetical protein
MCVILDRWLCILTGVAGAVLASQLPGYTLQYMQNLRGRLDELEPMVREFELDVQQYNYTIDEALVECRNATGFLDALCNSFESTVLRWEDLHAHYSKLEAATDYARPFVLMKSANRDIANSVAKEFEPAIPANDQGFVYALVGFLLMSGIITLLFHVLRCLCCRKPMTVRRRMMNRKQKLEDDDDVDPHFDTTDMTPAPVASKDAASLADKVPAVNPDYNPSLDERDHYADHRNDAETERVANTTPDRAPADTDSSVDDNKPVANRKDNNGYTFVGALYQSIFATKKDNYRPYVNTESGLTVPTFNRKAYQQQKDHHQDISIRIDP